MNGRIQVDIPLAIVGCDFRTAATARREALVTTSERRRDLYGSIRRIDPTAGFLALETCNRVEWIGAGQDPAGLAELLKAQILALWEAAFPEAASHPAPFVFTGGAAARRSARNGSTTTFHGEATGSC